MQLRIQPALTSFKSSSRSSCKRQPHDTAVSMPFWALNLKSLSCLVWLKINQSLLVSFQATGPVTPATGS
ncbi:hypothetical protein HAX54_015327 [Datura stramonium]|uniref:Uncharacterized protein n=1 Tax=Datura stramonium TaxID=4076 RepID=A0ABS8TPF5_DATST|nr:hypothetical protein [Datura stramonium]